MDKRTFIKDMGMIGAGVLVAGKSFAFKKDYLPKAPFKPDTLPYDFAALEPHIDTETMRIHYTKHYQAYIDNLNKAIVANPSYADQDILSIIKNVKPTESALRNNAGGYYNHSLFWKWLSPKTTKPSAKLESAITAQFGSFDSFKKEFAKAATGVFGSGWAWLVVDGKKLKIVSTPNQDNPLMSFSEAKGTPILGLDVWEHAYYLKHQNKRPEYIDTFWNVVNWDLVSSDYTKLT
ncbi:MAG: superoxide dismutase [Pseudopedobacter saltans]|uniref:Superoxide dismutase n=1 Tax=Pseudopedobacter saltans TaxID=151895 RepID=A0A2W5GB43_9SPHI|nr:MAG: superoxide dismutase [Pseudopedobacter saltans]